MLAPGAKSGSRFQRSSIASQEAPGRHHWDHHHQDYDEENYDYHYDEDDAFVVDDQGDKGSSYILIAPKSADSAF